MPWTLPFVGVIFALTESASTKFDNLISKFQTLEVRWLLEKVLKGLAMIFAGQENPLIIFRSKEIYIYFKTNNKIPINLLK